MHASAFKPFMILLCILNAYHEGTKKEEDSLFMREHHVPAP